MGERIVIDIDNAATIIEPIFHRVALLQELVSADMWLAAVDFCEKRTTGKWGAFTAILNEETIMADFRFELPDDYNEFIRYFPTQPLGLEPIHDYAPKAEMSSREFLASLIDTIAREIVESDRNDPDKATKH